MIRIVIMLSFCVFIIIRHGSPLGFLLYSQFVCKCGLVNSHKEVKKYTPISIKVASEKNDA